MTSLGILLPLLDSWRQLREGTRDNIIGGLVVAVIVGLAVVFRNTLISAARRLLTKGEGAPTPPIPQPQEITFKFEGIQPTQHSETSPKGEVEKPIRVPSIPRPPLPGFVARRDKDGRDIVERLREELTPEKDQVIVLWGAGGVGKTTLAAEAARSLIQDFAGHILWISAEGRPEFTLSTLLDEIAHYLGRSDLRQLMLAAKNQQVSEALAAAPASLIVLDNFETVDAKEQDLCADWLANRASCPALVTSRDEVDFARPIHILAMSLHEAQEFLQKLLAQTRNPRAFARLDKAQIIQAADRIPLVLQWVIKRIDSAKQPQAVLEDLAHGEGDAAKRVFDRSFDLPQVGDDGRAVLLALTLFVPSASRTALAEVAGFGKDVERLDQAIQQLVELWLIETTEANERLSVEGLTRELAKARFQKNEHADGFYHRFVNCFLSYAEAHAKPVPENHDALEAEKDNVLNAMDVAISLNDWPSTMQLMDAINFDGVNGFLTIRGHWEEAIRRGEQALKAARDLANEEQIFRFSHNLAITYQARGELIEAHRLYNESLEIKKRLGNQGGIANSLHQLARLAQEQGALDEARRLYHESLEINKRLGNQQGIAVGLHQLGRLAEAGANKTEAAQLFGEALAIFEKLKSPKAESARRSLERVKGESS